MVRKHVATDYTDAAAVINAKVCVRQPILQAIVSASTRTDFDVF